MSDVEESSANSGDDSDHAIIGGLGNLNLQEEKEEVGSSISSGSKVERKVSTAEIVEHCTSNRIVKLARVPDSRDDLYIRFSDKFALILGVKDLPNVIFQVCASNSSTMEKVRNLQMLAELILHHRIQTGDKVEYQEKDP